MPARSLPKRRSRAFHEKKGRRRSSGGCHVCTRLWVCTWLRSQVRVPLGGSCCAYAQAPAQAQSVRLSLSKSSMESLCVLGHTAATSIWGLDSLPAAGFVDLEFVCPKSSSARAAKSARGGGLEAMGQSVGCSLDDLPCCAKNTSSSHANGTRLCLFFPNSWAALGQGSTRVPHQGSTRVPRGSARAAGWCEH